MASPLELQEGLSRVEYTLNLIQEDVQVVREDVESFNTLSQQVRWAAILVGGVANLTYAGYYAFSTILEAERLWSVRLWMITHEWWWFSLATAVLVLALGLDIWAFLLGEDVDATILLLAFELGVTVSKVLIHAIRTHQFRVLLYRCWSGPSRTARPLGLAWLLDVHEWQWPDCLRCSSDSLPMRSVESKLNPCNVRDTLLAALSMRRCRILADLVDAMCVVQTQLARPQNPHDWSKPSPPGCLRAYAYKTSTDMSVHWGGEHSTLFQPRVSRGIMGLRQGEVVDAYDLRVTDTDRWKVAADGILARNKGLQPKLLICHHISSPDCPAETSSPLNPRPSKTLRTRVRHAIEAQYGGLGSSFVEAGTELNLLMRDMAHSDLMAWLRAGSEHQSLEADWELVQDAGSDGLTQLAYRLQYVGMLLSLQFANKLQGGRADQLVLLVAIKALHEKPAGALENLGVSIADLLPIPCGGTNGLACAKKQVDILGPPAIRIIAGYLGLWIAPIEAEKWRAWLLDVDGGWSGACAPGVSPCPTV